MKIIEVIPSKKTEFGVTKVPGSKSYTNRLLMMAALAQGKTVLKHPLESDDTKAMISALKLLGIKITKLNDSFVIDGNGGKFQKPKKEIYVENAGTAFRFLTAVLCTQSFSSTITGNKRMQERPIADLIMALQKLGSKISTKRDDGCPPVEIQGGTLNNNTTYVKGNVSSQYLSALLIAAPNMGKKITIKVKGKLTSAPYIRMTMQSMNDMGISINTNKNLTSFIIKPQQYKSGHYEVESDASSASYPLALAAIHGAKIKLLGLGSKSLQADLGLIKVLRKFGCKVNLTSESITVQGPKKLIPLGKINLNEMPDAAMTVAIIAAFASGKTELTGLANLRVKECDRIKALATELGKVGVNVKEKKTSLVIYGNPEDLHGAFIETYNDHRMAMCFGILGSKVQGIKIINPNCVSKTYPAFWSDLNQLGVKQKKFTQKENIYLCGMRGSGKSTLGNELAKRLGYEFIDTDKLIEAKHQKRVAEIIQQNGWKYFREQERKTAVELRKYKKTVVSTGGGFILNTQNQKVMKQNGIIIFLKSDLDVLVQRIKKDKNNIRPSLSNDKTIIQELSTVWKERKNIYYTLSDIILETSINSNNRKNDVNKKIEHLLELLKKNECLKN